MRYLLAVFIAALIVTVDFAQENSDQPLRGEPLGTAHAQRKLSSEVSESHEEDLTTHNNLSSLELNSAVNETSSEDRRVTSVSIVSEVAPVSLNRVCEAIKDAAEDSGIPVGFFARLLWQESKFRPEEISSAGARGIAQFMPKTAVEVGLSDPFDPLQAIPASARFLRKLHNQFGNLGLAAAAYNAGGGRIEKWLSRRGPLPRETRAYVLIITGNKAEDWATESKMISVPTVLPRRAPCDGVGRLSKSKHRPELVCQNGFHPGCLRTRYTPAA